MEEEIPSRIRIATVNPLATVTATATPVETGTAIRMDGTAEIGVNVAALHRLRGEGIHLTGGAGATPGVLQEAAAREGTMMRLRLWRARPTVVGDRTTQSRAKNKVDGQGQEVVKCTSDEVVSSFVAPRLNFSFSTNPVKNWTVFDNKMMPSFKLSQMFS